MLFFKKAGTVKSIEAEFAALEKRRDLWAKKLETAHGALDQARADRRQFVLEGDADDVTTLAKMDARIAVAERDVAALTSDMVDLDASISATRQRLEETRDAEHRAKVAAEREAAAAKVAPAAARLQRAVEELAVAFDALAGVIPDRVVQIYEANWGARPANSTEAARCILGEAIFSSHPSLLEVYGLQTISAAVTISLPVRFRRRDGSYDAAVPKDNSEVVFSSAPQAALAAIVEPLRHSAEAIRAGAISADSPVEPTRPPPPVETPAIQFKTVYLLRSIFYISQTGTQVREEAGNFLNLPEPVADAALKVGAALEPDDPRVDDDRLRWRRDPFTTREQTRTPINLTLDWIEILEAVRSGLCPAPKREKPPAPVDLEVDLRAAE